VEAQEVISGKCVLSVSPHTCKSYSIVVLMWYLLIMDIILLVLQIFVHPHHARVDDVLYFWLPPLVLAKQGSYSPYLPPRLLGDNLHAWHPQLNYQVKASFIGILFAQEVKASFPIILPVLHRIFLYFKPLIDHGNNNGSFLDKQQSMFSEWLEIDYIITGPQHLRPPSGSTPGHVCFPM
jgi:hypothetical protein